VVDVRQLDAVTRELLARIWAAGAGPGDLAGPLTIDLDSSIVPVYGRGKQGAAFGYTKVRGYHPQFATCAQTGMVLFSRLRAAIDAIPEGAWTPIPYWLSSPEVSGADVAETYTAFSGKDAMTVRLVVRRVRPTPGSRQDSSNAVGNFCFEVSLGYRRVERPRRVPDQG
jgi:hypothetical protein